VFVVLVLVEAVEGMVAVLAARLAVPATAELVVVLIVELELVWVRMQVERRVGLGQIVRGRVPAQI
jgi:hypothetical protein